MRNRPPPDLLPGRTAPLGPPHASSSFPKIGCSNRQRATAQERPTCVPSAPTNLAIARRSNRPWPLCCPSKAQNAPRNLCPPMRAPFRCGHGGVFQRQHLPPRARNRRAAHGVRRARPRTPLGTRGDRQHDPHDQHPPDGPTHRTFGADGVARRFAHAQQGSVLPRARAHRCSGKRQSRAIRRCALVLRSLRPAHFCPPTPGRSLLTRKAKSNFGTETRAPCSAQP